MTTTPFWRVETSANDYWDFPEEEQANTFYRLFVSKEDYPILNLMHEDGHGPEMLYSGTPETLAEFQSVHDYDGTERTVEWMHEHLRATHNYHPEVLNNGELAEVHAEIHRAESGIGDREPTTSEVAAVVMQYIDETINDRDWVNTRGEPMPWNVQDFSTLHDYCDANMLLHEAEVHFGGTGWDFEDGDEAGFQAAADRANAITDEVTALLTARVDGVKDVMFWQTGECYARVLNPSWLTDRSFILCWTDYVTQEESFRFETLSEAVVCLGVLIHCGEDAWRSGFNVDNDGMAVVISDFFGKAVS